MWEQVRVPAPRHRLCGRSQPTGLLPPSGATATIHGGVGTELGPCSSLSQTWPPEPARPRATSWAPAWPAPCLGFPSAAGFLSLSCRPRCFRLQPESMHGQLAQAPGSARASDDDTGFLLARPEQALSQVHLVGCPVHSPGHTRTYLLSSFPSSERCPRPVRPQLPLLLPQAPGPPVRQGLGDSTETSPRDLPLPQG